MNAPAVVVSGSAGVPALERALTTPSAQQSGLKLNVNLAVASNQLADFVLDFNACKSVVVAGNSGKHLLKPVMAVFPRVSTGMAVDGYVGNWTARTAVSLQLNGAVVRSTVPDANGYFVLPYLPNAGLGPYGALNPYQLWWAVILIAGLSLAGHFAMRFTGAQRGILWTGLLGGLASSTAATLALAALGVSGAVVVACDA